MKKVHTIHTLKKGADAYPATVDDTLCRFLSSLDVRPSSRTAYAKAMRRFLSWVEASGRDIRSLRREDIVAFKEALLPDNGRKVSELTASLYLTAVRRFYEWAESERLYPNIAAGVKNPHRRNRFKKMHLTEEQGAAYMDTFTRASGGASCVKRRRTFTNLSGMSLRDEAAVALMLYCGLRTIEVARADVGDVTFRSGRRILKVQGKGRDAKDAYVVLIDEAWEPLERYLDTRPRLLPGEPLFICEGYGSRGRRISTRRIQAICKQGFRSIGLDGHEYSAHSLRHTTGVMIVKHGGGLLDVQTVLRHASTTTSQIYIESAAEDIRISNAPERRLSGCFKRNAI